MSDLQILYQDNEIVAINKPNGMLVHRTKIASNTDKYILQELRNQIGLHVHPAHRLDRKTSGVLLFTLNKESLSKVRIQFEKKTVQKKYLAIVRGYTVAQDTIDYNLINEKGKSQKAITHYRTLKSTEINLPFGKHQTSRYSLVEVSPETGRYHQIRKHFAHIFHPIIGDRPHGCNKQNKLFLEHWHLSNMLLHASELKINHPSSDNTITFKADTPSEFKRMLAELKLS